MKVIEPTVFGLTEKPEPATVTVIPVTPCEGVRVIAGTVTVKEAEAVSAGTEPTSLPEAMTVLAPAVDDGTVKVQVKVPVEDVVVVVQVWVPGVAPLNVNVAKVVLTEKPDPAAVTVIPMGP